MGRISGIVFGLPSSNRHGSVHTAAGRFVASEEGASVTGFDNGEPWGLETGTAEAIITPGAKAIEIEDIEARVLELERAAETTKHW